jgi:redox-sensitive bicupin YhaK (pirin superfamily)
VKRDLSRRAFLAAIGAGGTASLLGCRADEPSKPAPEPSIPEVRPPMVVVPPRASKDGAGVRLAKTLGSAALPMLDPFLMLDEIRSEHAEDYVKGFPNHPHRGFETVTIVLSGSVEHRDSAGNEGVLGAGSVQWMTAGHGIIHSEMPLRTEGLLWALQLWVNLPKSLKMTAPKYQDVQRDRIAEIGVAGGHARVLAGRLDGTAGPVEGIAVAPTMLDVTIEPGGTFQHELPATNSVFAFVLEGDVHLGGSGGGAASKPTPRGNLVTLGTGRSLRAESAGGGRILVVAAEPIGETVARRGPFVMNTQEELDQAFADYRSGRLTQI